LIFGVLIQNQIKIIQFNRKIENTKKRGHVAKHRKTPHPTSKFRFRDWIKKSDTYLSFQNRSFTQLQNFQIFYRYCWVQESK